MDRYRVREITLRVAVALYCLAAVAAAVAVMAWALRHPVLVIPVTLR